MDVKPESPLQKPEAPIRGLTPGAVIETWCSACNQKTAHVCGWIEKRWLTCLRCRPECDPQKDKRL